MTLFIYLFGLGCAGSFLLCGLFLQLQQAWTTLQSQRVGLLMWWLLLLGSAGSRHSGFNSCGSWALEHRLNSCSTQAQMLCGMWDLPKSGIEPVSPALADRFFTTEPSEKPNLSKRDKLMKVLEKLQSTQQSLPCYSTAQLEAFYKFLANFQPKLA